MRCGKMVRREKKNKGGGKCNSENNTASRSRDAHTIGMFYAKDCEHVRLKNTLIREAHIFGLTW